MDPFLVLNHFKCVYSSNLIKFMSDIFHGCLHIGFGSLDMPRKGKPPMGWRGVNLLQGFCPFCFKGKIGKSSGRRVPPTSRLIDEVQALHARRGNGLCVLDLKSPGDFCANPSLCKLVCLVCGKATVDGEEPAFEVFRNACCEDVDDLDRPSRYEVQEAMDEHDLVWTDQWDTPVHARCAKKAPCKCVVPLGATECFTHKRRLVPKRLPAAPPAPVPSMPQIVKPSSDRARPAGKVVLGTATWLKPPTLTSKTYESGASSGAAQAKKPAARPAQPARKPNLKMEAAAKTCSYKINAWAVSRMERGGPGTDGAKPGDAGGTSAKFNFSKHQDEYDPYNPNHGYRLRNGAWTYAFPDGRVVPAGSVNEITPDGELIPLSF